MNQHTIINANRQTKSIVNITRIMNHYPKNKKMGDTKPESDMLW